MVTNSASSLCNFFNFLKGCNCGADRSLPPGELIIDDTPKALLLVKSHHTDVITCSSLIRIFSFPSPHCWRYICAHIYFNWWVNVALISVVKGNLKSSVSIEKTLLWKLLFCVQKINDLVTKTRFCFEYHLNVYIWDHICIYVWCLI